jgi:hypothetical protein
MHFDDKSWLDFVRRLLNEDERWLLQQHLTVGCNECLRAHSFWSRITEMVARELDYEPDASDIRIVAAAYTAEKPEISLPKSTKLAQLIFDSFRDASPAGFRSALMLARHMVFSAGQWTISLRIKNESGNQVFLAGHITRAESGSGEPRRMQVTLRQAGSLAGSATTNDSGEFHLRYVEVLDVWLFVNVSEAETLEIPLPHQNLTDEEISFED